MSDPTGQHHVIFHLGASAEYLRARRRYAKQGGERLAQRFVDEVDQAVERIAESPERWPIFRVRYHWVRLHRFPYLLYYQVLDDVTILVLAVAHASRRPGYWLRRAVP
jgi:toxin ParE1/3/4